MRWLVGAVLMLTLTVPAAAAENAAQEVYREQLDASGAEELVECLPSSVQEVLEQWGMDLFSPASYTDLHFPKVLQMTMSLLERQGGGAMQAFGVLLGVVVISALFSSLEWTTESQSLRQTYHAVAVLAGGSALMIPLFRLLHGVGETVDQVTVFMTGYIPVYAMIVATGGSAAGAVSYQTTLMAASQMLVWLIRQGVFPVLTVSLALGCTGTVTQGLCLDRVSDALHKTVLWVLGLFCTLFSGVLSLQQMAAAAGDTLGGRVMKFSLSSFVPVVGGLLSEAYSTVVGCAGLLRSTMGCFGLLTTVLIVAAPLLECVCWLISLQLAGGAASLFGLDALEKLCRTAAGAVRVLVAVLAAFALIMVVSTTVLVFVGRGS